jgi:hypothetical protein
METAVGHIQASGLTEEDKETLIGMVITDQSLIAGINLAHSDGVLRAVIQHARGECFKISHPNKHS